MKAAEAAEDAPPPAWVGQDLDVMELGKLDGTGTSNEMTFTSLDAFADWYTDNPDATIIAGATDVGLWVTKALRDLQKPVFISGISELRQIKETADSLVIGAGVTMEAFRTFIADHHPSYAEMVRRYGSEQVRQAATIGGNIANGSPIGDNPPALIALDAILHLRCGQDRRSLRLEDFFIDYGKQDRKQGEFVEAVEIPRQADNLKVYKLSKRFDQDISAVCGAFNIRVADGAVEDARIAFGGMAAIPKRAVKVESLLIGQPWTPESVENAIGGFAEDFQPISDMRASATYRLTTAQNMLRRIHAEDQGVAANVLEVTP